MNKKNQKGFSLVELLVVVAIIGILAAVGVVTYNGYIQNARETVVKQNHSGLVAMITAEAAKCGMSSSAEFLNAGTACSDMIDSEDIADAVDVYISANIDNPYPGQEISPDDPIDAADDPSDFELLACAGVYLDGHSGTMVRGGIQVLHDSDAIGIQGRWITVHSCIDATEVISSKQINMY